MLSYRIAAVDLDNRMLPFVVVVAFGTTPGELHLLAQWRVEQEVEEVVMESTGKCPVAGWIRRCE
jgi:hypothetical protein